MPGDSLNINNRSVAQNTYDAIVIGTGVSGGWAAKELTEKGLKTLELMGTKSEDWGLVEIKWVKETRDRNTRMGKPP